MRKWSEVDLPQVDLANLSAEDRQALCAEVERRARLARAQVLRDGIAWLRRILRRPRRRPAHRQVYAPVPQGPLDLIFGGRA